MPTTACHTDNLPDPAAVAAGDRGTPSTSGAGRGFTPNRCASCGRFVGATFTGYEHDRTTARAPLFCDRCAVPPPKRRAAR
jgi:hypothetical protein